jgi:hypothetical protein
LYTLDIVSIYKSTQREGQVGRKLYILRIFWTGRKKGGQAERCTGGSTKTG